MVVHHLPLQGAATGRLALRRSTASARVTTGVVAARRGGLEVHRGRLDPGRADPDHGARSSGRSAGTTAGSAPPCTSSPATGRRATRTPSWCWSAASTRACSTRMQYARSLAPDRLIAVSVVERRRGAGRGSSRQWARVQHPDRAAHHLLAVPRAHPPDPAATSTSSTPSTPTTSSPSSSPSSSRRGAPSGCTTSRPSPSKARLLYRPHTAVVSVPVHMHDGVVEEV